MQNVTFGAIQSSPKRKWKMSEQSWLETLMIWEYRVYFLVEIIYLCQTCNR